MCKKWEIGIRDGYFNLTFCKITVCFHSVKAVFLFPKIWKISLNKNQSGKRVVGMLKAVKTNIENGEYTAREMILAGSILFLLGLVIGLLISPRKTMTFGSHNGNNTNSFNGTDQKNMCKENEKEQE